MSVSTVTGWSDANLDVVEFLPAADAVVEVVEVVAVEHGAAATHGAD